MHLLVDVHPVSIPNRDFDELQLVKSERRDLARVSIPNRDFDELQ